MKVQHCGLTDLVPADVAASYLEAYRMNNWSGKVAQKVERAEYESRPAPREHVTSY